MKAIGPDGVPSLTHRAKLRYIDALIYEVMRCATVIPLVAHATWKDTTIGGYDVPANIEGNKFDFEKLFLIGSDYLFNIHYIDRHLIFSFRFGNL